jgi:hypothetical protein
MIRTLLVLLSLVAFASTPFAQSTSTTPMAPAATFEIKELWYKTSETGAWHKEDLTGMNINIPAAAAAYNMEVHGTYTPNNAGLAGDIILKQNNDTKHTTPPIPKDTPDGTWHIVLPHDTVDPNKDYRIKSSTPSGSNDQIKVNGMVVDVTQRDFTINTN